MWEKMGGVLGSGTTGEGVNVLGRGRGVLRGFRRGRCQMEK